MEEVLNLLEDVMNLDEGVLEADMVLGELEEWDSLSKLALMVEIKSNYGKKVTAREVAQFIVVKDVYDYLQA